MKPLSIPGFIKELRRRRVFRGVIVYGASTLILLEAAQNLCNVFGIAAVPKWFVLVLAIGFLISLWFSWMYDFTPGGIRKTESDSEQAVPISQKEITIYKTTTSIAILIIIALLSYRIVDRSHAKKIAGIDRTIAVLPLNDREIPREELRRYEFIGHEITACLTKIRDYRVQPWEECRKYPRSESSSYAQMGQDLSAAILINWKPYETSEEKYLSVDLIGVNNEQLLWSQNFKIEGNWPTEICKYSGKISKKIARKLRTPLTLKERSLISEEPVSARATMYASLGTAMTNDIWERVKTGVATQTGTQAGSMDTVISEYTDSISFDRAIAFFTDAIRENPEYAEAYARRAKARLWGMNAGYYNKSELHRCETDIMKAFELDPNHPEAHVAMGFYYYYGVGDYLLALTSLEKAVFLNPVQIEYLFYLSLVRRALGHWDEVRKLSDLIFEEHPRNALFLTNLGLSYLYLQDFPKAIECQERAIALLPKWYAPYINKTEALIAMGQLGRARAVVMDFSENTNQECFRIEAVIDLYEKKYEDAIDHIERAGLQEFLKSGLNAGDSYLLKAKIYKHAGHHKQAKENYSLALDYYQKQLLFHPDDHILFSKLGVAYAGLDESAQARDYGQRAFEFTWQQDDPKDIPFILYDLIQLYAMTGDRESAHRMMALLLDRNTYFTSGLLRYDPDIQLILDEPG